MARMHIISADGERFESISDRRFIYRRLISILALLITAIFLSAAIIGLNNARHPAAQPTMTHTAKAVDQGLSFASAKRACRIAKTHTPAWGACIDLYMRHAWHDDRNYTPEGAVLVKECISQYRGQELTDCFTQEIG